MIRSLLFLTELFVSKLINAHLNICTLISHDWALILLIAKKKQPKDFIWPINSYGDMIPSFSLFSIVFFLHFVSKGHHSITITCTGAYLLFMFV